ncbi:MAG: metallophosphoesterase family protein, partial [Acidimicrobiia bacterium]
AYPRGDPPRLRDTVFEPFAAVFAQGTRLLAVLGNHDVLDGHGNAQLQALGQRGRWWAEEWGDLLLVGLDSNPPVPDEQIEFVERTLTASTARWRVVALHHPPYSAGYQGSDRSTRELFAPIFGRHRVDVVLSAHDHDYQRSVPIDGVTYIVTGGAARARFTGTRAFTAESFRVRHFVEVMVAGDHLVVRGIDQQGRVFDEFSLQRARAATVMRDRGVNAS